MAIVMTMKNENSQKKWRSKTVKIYTNEYTFPFSIRRRGIIDTKTTPMQISDALKMRMNLCETVLSFRNFRNAWTKNEFTSIISNPRLNIKIWNGLEVFLSGTSIFFAKNVATIFFDVLFTFYASKIGKEVTMT